MSSEKFNYNNDDVALAKFALALGLPVRVYIIRTIAKQNNAATKAAFDQSPFNTELIFKHISQLKSLGILQAKSHKGITTYRIDKLFFGIMSQKFNLLFESLSQINTGIPANLAAYKAEDLQNQNLNFGAYLKAQRLSFQFSQQDFAKRLLIERAALSKIESGKLTFPAEKLEVLSTIIHEDIAIIKKIYYSDHLVTLLQKGNINDATFEFAKKKADR